MDSEYKSKMDFLLERAKTTKRSAPPHRKGETVDPSDLWRSVYKNKMQVGKTMSHASSHVHLQLAERNTFEEYWGTDEIDAFKNFNVEDELDRKETIGNTVAAIAPPAFEHESKMNEKEAPRNADPAASAPPAPRIRDRLLPTSNGHIYPVQISSPALATTSIANNSKSPVEVEVIGSDANDGLQGTSPSRYQTSTGQSRSRFLVSGRVDGEVPRRAELLASTPAQRHVSFQLPPRNQPPITPAIHEPAALHSTQLQAPNIPRNGQLNVTAPEVVFAKVLTAAELFYGEVYRRKYNSYPRDYDAANASKKYPIGINIRNTRRTAFVFTHEDVANLEWGNEACMNSNTHNFMPRTHTKINSLLLRGDKPTGIMWIDFKTFLDSVDYAAAAAEYKGLLNGLQIYYALDGNDWLPSLKTFYEAGNNKRLFQRREAFAPFTPGYQVEHLISQFQATGPRNAERVVPPERLSRSERRKLNLPIDRNRGPSPRRSRSPPGDRTANYRDRQANQYPSKRVEREERLLRNYDDRGSARAKRDAEQQKIRGEGSS